MLSTIKRGITVKLVPNSVYEFKIKDFETPFGEVIKTDSKIRRYIATISRGPKGLPKEKYYKVEYLDGGKIHLIHVNSVESAVKLN